MALLPSEADRTSKLGKYCLLGKDDVSTQHHQVAELPATMSQEYLTSTDNVSELITRRLKFIHHLDGLKGEFEVLVQQIESLQKERDEYKARGLLFQLTTVKMK